jgi:hypothetical protein
MHIPYRAIFEPIIFVLLLTATSVDAQALLSQATTNQVPYTVSVLASEARFVFPLPLRREWEWYQTTTADRSREYRFSVALQNRDQGYELGFFLFKPPGAKPTRGSVDALLRAGQTSVAAVVGGRTSVLPDARARLRVATTRLMLVVDDQKTLRLLFSDRPNHATFNIDIPGEDTTTKQVTIAYAQP